MSKTVARTCTELSVDGPEADDAMPKTLADYRSVHAYVLLGDPGSGKTTAFRTEREALGDGALFTTARDFLLGAMAPDELRGKTLFIDGLDEVRAGKQDARTPFDEIRKLLIQLDKPRFRISCREADWLGENDRTKLAIVVPESDVVVLHLDPLTDADIIEILRDGLGLSEPERFFNLAHQAGLAALLANPQALELLARAVGHGNGWPTSRRQVFDLACREMASERNREHQIAGPANPSTEALIDCAGRICALMLLSDKAGYSLAPAATAGNYIPREPCGGEDPGCQRAAVSSKLFRADSEGGFSPVHRQIAEFLGAKHLAQLIQAGLSPRRVLALMIGSDGVAVSALRGLSGWLATHSEAIRAELIRKNPVDLGIYGDLDAFSPDEKGSLLRALLAQPMSLARAFSNAERFVPLVAPTTESQLQNVLTSEDRDSEQEVRMRFLLFLLSMGQPQLGLVEVILGIVRDNSRPAQVRANALDAFIHYQQDQSGGEDQLRALLNEFRGEGISIANRDLCGRLLRVLYPRCVGPIQVWDYFTHLGGASSWDHYLKFWRRALLLRSTDAGIAELLDALATSISRLEATIDALRLGVLPLELLQRGLRLHGKSVGIDRVSAWLGTCTRAAEGYVANPPDSLLEIRAWLESHPSVQKQIILAGLESCQGGENIGLADLKNRRRLLGAKLPDDLGRWCLMQAVRLADTNPGVAKHLFLEAHRSLHAPDVRKGLSLKVVEEHARQHPLLKGALRRLQAPPPAPQSEPRWKQHQATYLAEQEKERDQLLADIRSHKNRLLENSGPPVLLYRIALVYFGESLEVGPGATGKGAIAQALRDTAAITGAMHGLRHSVDRDDLPSSGEVVRLARNSREHYLSLPLLAGLQELQESAPGSLLELDDSRLRTCVACLHCWEPHFLGVEDTNLAWYQTLLDHRPEIVSDIAVQCAAGALRRNGMISPRFWKILEGQDGGPTSQDSALGLLRALPTRCNARQVEALDELLWAGLRFGWQSDLLGLAESRLLRRGIDAGQRTRWLGVGLICEPGKYAEKLAKSVQGKERLVKHLARFLVHGDDSFSPEAAIWYSSLEELDPSSLALLVRLLGRFFVPYEPIGFTLVSDEVRVSHFLGRVINALGSRPCPGASDSLDSLLADAQLSSWHPLLSAVRTAQRTLRRDAEFRHPTLQQACETLGRSRPANACDLAALTIDTIEAIACRIRSSNSNEWRQYWNEGLHGKPSKPKVEEACRDAFLAALRPLVPRSVTVEPEGQNVNRNRADLLVAAEELKIPIEAKKNDHDDLWRAISDQLIAKYTLDPATGGYGIYIIFWFGEEYQRRRADGAKPKSPQDLERLLQNSLTEDLARKIQVCVIDVCRPGPPQDG